MRELVKDGITCPRMADAGSDGTNARVAVAMELYGRRLQVLVGCWGIVGEEEAAGA